MSSLTPQPFLDRYGIWAGQTGIDERGQAWVQDMPVGVRLAVQPARKSEVFIVPERPWEQGTVSPTCVLCEEGVLRLWYFSQGAEDWVRAELVEPPTSPASPGRAMPGYGLGEADVLAGDEVSGVVTWRGRSDLSALKGKAVSVRLHLARARVFSVAL